MKRIVAVLALCACAQGARAAGPDCRAIQGAGERLACYDAASLPKKDKPASVESDASRAAYKDPNYLGNLEKAGKACAEWVSKTSGEEAYKAFAARVG